jgi:hypothetical protein
MRPYAWSAIGPISTSPLEGLGIDARRITDESLPSPGAMLDEDAERRVGGAAAPQEACGEVEVDVGEVGELLGVRAGITGPLELLQPPAPDELRFQIDFEFEFYSRHLVFLPLIYLPGSV